MKPPLLGLPTPFVVTGGQFMQCAGQDIAPGADPDTVKRACGAPDAVRQFVQTTPAGKQIVEVWSYGRPNRITRNLRFENGVLSSIDTVHQAIR